MLDFMKRLFAKAPELKKLALTRSDLPGWLKTERQEREKSLDGFLKQWLIEWKDAVIVLRKRLQELEEAKLQNPKIPEKHKDFMTGNRKEFIRRLTVFIDRIETPASVSGVPAAIQEWQRTVAELVKGMARPAAILSEFFSVQVGNVQKALGVMEANVTALANEHNTRLPPALDKLETILADKETEQKRKAELQHATSHAAQQHARYDADLHSLHVKIRAIEASKEHTALQSLRQELTAAQDRQHAVKAEIVSAVSSLEDALARYQRISSTKLIDDLRKQPLEVAEKHAAKLADLVSDMKGAIERGSIDLKDKKREKALNACALVTKQWLEERLHKIATSHAEETALIKKINATGLVEKMAHLRAQEKALADDTKRIVEDAAAAQAKLEKIDLARHDVDIVSTAKELGYEITLT